MKSIEEAREALEKGGHLLQVLDDERVNSRVEIFAQKALEARGYSACYETDPHVRALVEKARIVCKLHAPHGGPGYLITASGVADLEEALRPFEKEEKILNPSPEAGKL